MDAHYSHNALGEFRTADTCLKAEFVKDKVAEVHEHMANALIGVLSSDRFKENTASGNYLVVLLPMQRLTHVTNRAKCQQYNEQQMSL